MHPNNFSGHWNRPAVSANGGGENSPKLTGQDDYYEMFIAELRNMGIALSGV